MIYISCDIEANGLVPGIHSMLSIGLAAFNENGEIVSKYFSNLKPISSGIEDPATMEWWKSEPQAWIEATTDPKEPEIVTDEIVQWVSKLPQPFKLVGYPLSFDQSFINWYMVKFSGVNIFGHNGIDIRSYVMGMMNCGFKESSKSNIPQYVLGIHPHTHNALDDAISQGNIFINLIKLNLNKNFYSERDYINELNSIINSVSTEIERENDEKKSYYKAGEYEDSRRAEDRVDKLYRRKSELMEKLNHYEKLKKQLAKGEQ